MQYVLICEITLRAEYRVDGLGQSFHVILTSQLIYS